MVCGLFSYWDSTSYNGLRFNKYTAFWIWYHMLSECFFWTGVPLEGPWSLDIHKISMIKVIIQKALLFCWVKTVELNRDMIGFITLSSFKFFKIFINHCNSLRILCCFELTMKADQFLMVKLALTATITLILEDKGPLWVFSQVVRWPTLNKVDMPEIPT